MSKYDPLTKHLTRQNAAEVSMTFTELEKVLGFTLPPSARKHRAWWSNNPDNNVMTKAWIEAGYNTADVEIEREKLAFQKLNAVTENLTAVSGFSEAEAAFEARPRRHPLFGAWKGLVTIEEGYDLTQPADPDWGDVYK